jgi:hypothetical protein
MHEITRKVAELCAAGAALARNEFWLASGALLLLFGAGVASDLLGSGGTVIGGVVQLLLQWSLFRHVARREGWIGEGNPTGGVFGLIGLGIIETFGVLLACLLLLLPGLYLAARWSASSAILIAEDVSPMDAVAASWKRTRSSGVAIAFTLCGIYLPIVVVLGGIVFWGNPDAETTLAETLPMNAAIAWATVAGWYLALAVYDRTRTPQVELEQVFA